MLPRNGIIFHIPKQSRMNEELRDLSQHTFTEYKDELDIVWNVANFGYTILKEFDHSSPNHESSHHVLHNRAITP